MYADSMRNIITKNIFNNNNKRKEEETTRQQLHSDTKTLQILHTSVHVLKAIRGTDDEWWEVGEL